MKYVLVSPFYRQETETWRAKFTQPLSGRGGTRANCYAIQLAERATKNKHYYQRAVGSKALRSSVRQYENAPAKGWHLDKAPGRRGAGAGGRCRAYQHTGERWSPTTGPASSRTTSFRGARGPGLSGAGRGAAHAPGAAGRGEAGRGRAL